MSNNVTIPRDGGVIMRSRENSRSGGFSRSREYSPSSDGWDFKVYGSLWLCFCTAFLCSPFIFSSRKRRRCLNRIRGRQDSDDDDEDGRFFVRVRGDARARNRRNESTTTTDVTTSSAIRLETSSTRRHFIHSLIRNFTMELTSEDLIPRDGGINGDAIPVRKELKLDDDVDLEFGSSKHSSAGAFCGVTIPLPGTCAQNVTTSGNTTTDLSDPSTVSDDDRCLHSDERNENDEPSLAATTQAPHVFRIVPNCCAICLDGFSETDRISWSSNISCNHAFHEDCVVSWLIMMRKKKMRRRNNANNSSNDEVGNDDEFLKASYLTCPCCRRPFVDLEHEQVNHMTNVITKNNSGDTCIDGSISAESGDADDQEQSGVAASAASVDLEPESPTTYGIDGEVNVDATAADDNSDDIFVERDATNNRDTVPGFGNITVVEEDEEGEHR